MNSQKTSQEGATGGAPCAQAATGSGPTDGQSSQEAGARGDFYFIAQAARSVMHPERHEPEWRFYHGAVTG